ncbi:MAG: iron ABC transporter permease [Candidatus Aureabacteria bacterium]|nr:iron ABC transporter permease [Candidatus Auribacterota bacterium]
MKKITVILLVALVTAGLFMTSLLVGPADINIGNIFDYFCGKYNPVIHLRFMRACMAVISAAGLSAAGVFLQGLLRNPLAGPYILGISAGSAIGAVGAICCGLGTAFILLPVPMVCAFIGAIITIIVVYRLALKDGNLSVQNLILAGIAVNSLLSSVLLFAIYSSKNEAINGIIWWLLGSLQVFDIRIVLFSGGIVSASILLAIPLTKELNAVSIGDDLATYVGIKVEWIKTIFFVLSGIMTAAVVSSVGMIGFVGLVIPHITRKLFGPDIRVLLPASVVIGSGFLLIADMLCRILFIPAELPIGIVTSLVGAPFFIFILVITRKGS